MNLQKKVEDALLQGFKKTYPNFEKGAKLFVDPKQITKIESLTRAQYAFLERISTIPTLDAYGQIIAMGQGQSVGQRTVVPTPETIKVNRHEQRNPVDISGLTGRTFKLEELELDVRIAWQILLQWGVISEDVMKEYNAYVLRSRALSRLRIGLYGQSENTLIGSDLSLHAMQEDVQKGWLQYMIEHKPDHVLGIEVVDKSVDPKGYRVSNQYKIGKGGDFTSVADACNEMKLMIPKVYRGNNAIAAIVGDEIGTYDHRQLIKAAEDSAMNRAAVEGLLQVGTIAKMEAIVPDECPSRLIMVTDPKNLEYRYQQQGVKRMVGDSHDMKGWCDYLWMQTDFTVQLTDSCVMIHPDAVLMKNAAGEWVASSDTWAINPVV